MRKAGNLQDLRQVLLGLGAALIVVGLLLAARVLGDVHGGNESRTQIVAAEIAAAAPGLITLMAGLIAVAIAGVVEFVRRRQGGH
jgi:hypothetical protein